MQQWHVINLLTLIFWDLIKVVEGVTKTIPYDIHVSVLILKRGCDISINTLIALLKYTSFDKNIIAWMHYVCDEYDNYVKKAGHEKQKHPRVEEHEEEVQEQQF